MPEISRFHGIVIQMYWDDHSFPHFHAFAAGRMAKVRIDKIEVLRSTLTRRQLTMVCKWAAVHQAELEKNWRRARVHATLEHHLHGSIARVVRHEVVNLTFEDGQEGEVDLSARLWGPVFEQVRTPAGFAELYIDETGGTIAWPGPVDLAPDTLYIRVKTGEWPPGLAQDPALTPWPGGRRFGV